MRCANCGKGVFSAVSICPFCREPFGADTRREFKQTSTTSKPAKSGTKMKLARWQIMLASALVVAVITPFAVLWATSGLIEPIVRQLDDFRHDDLQGAYAEMSASFHQEVPFERFSEFVKSHPSAFHNVSHSFTSRSSSNSMAGGTGTGDVRGSITDDHGGVMPIHYGLVKENGAWKIKRIYFGQTVGAQSG